MGVGRRRLITGPPVAHGPGVGARALRPHTKAAVTADARDAAATAADGDDVDHRHLDREASDRAVRGDRRRAALDQAHVGAGSTDVRGQDAVVAGRSYSRYSGSTSDEMDTFASGSSRVTTSRIRRSCSGLA